MKFNLKNRPRKIHHYRYSSSELDTWFEGIEKELREKIVAITLEYQHPSWEFWKGWNKAIREVLGE